MVCTTSDKRWICLTVDFNPNLSYPSRQLSLQSHSVSATVVPGVENIKEMKQSLCLTPKFSAGKSFTCTFFPKPRAGVECTHTVCSLLPAWSTLAKAPVGQLDAWSWSWLGPLRGELSVCRVTRGYGSERLFQPGGCLKAQCFKGCFFLAQL